MNTGRSFSLRTQVDGAHGHAFGSQEKGAGAFPMTPVTSTTSRTRASIASAPAETGFLVTADDSLTAPVIAAAYLRDHYSGAWCLPLNSGTSARIWSG